MLFMLFKAYDCLVSVFNIEFSILLKASEIGETNMCINLFFWIHVGG